MIKEIYNLSSKNLSSNPKVLEEEEKGCFYDESTLSVDGGRRRRVFDIKGKDGGIRGMW